MIFNLFFSSYKRVATLLFLLSLGLSISFTTSLISQRNDLRSSAFGVDLVEAQAGGCETTRFGLDQEEKTMIQLINNYRQSNGRSVLAVSGNLNRVASSLAESEAIHGYTAHTDYLGRGMSQRLADCGVSYTNAGEIAVYRKTTQIAFDAWKTSSSHNENMLNPEHAALGVGRALWTNGNYIWIVDFATPNPGGAVTDDDTPEPTAIPTNTPTPTSPPTTPTTSIPTNTPGPTNLLTPVPTGTIGAFQEAGNSCQLGAENQADNLVSIQATPFICNIGEECNNIRLSLPGSVGRTRSTPTNTPGPTNTPTKTATKAPTPTFSATTPSPGSNTSVGINLTITLPGISNSYVLGQNATPISATRGVQIVLSKPGGESGKKFTGTVSFDSQSGSFKGNITMSGVPNGIYTVKVGNSNSLCSALPEAITISSDSNTPLTSKLISGDVNQDNRLDLQDYNILVSCYGTRACSTKTLSDLNMDAKVDEKDINIFYTGLAKRSGD